MNLKEIKQLIDHVNKSDLTEFSWSKDGERVVLKKEKEILSATATPMMAAPVAAASALQQSTPSESGSEEVAPIAGNLKEITSPMVGTFYTAPSPDSDPFVKVGDRVKAGQVVCIVEAMKLMNEIESDLTGVIEEMCVENGTPIEYGSPLFRVKPD